MSKQNEKYLQEIVKKYKQGLIFGLYQGNNITFTSTGCRDKIISSTSSGIGGGIQSIQEGDNITIDNTDPLNPIVNASDDINGVKNVIFSSGINGVLWSNYINTTTHPEMYDNYPKTVFFRFK